MNAYRVLWLEQLQRLDATWLQEQMFRYKPRGIRDMGRHRKTLEAATQTGTYPVP